jgi:tetratricopeptide (TPR) repeat protein
MAVGHTAIAARRAQPRETRDSAYQIYTRGVELAAKKKYADALEKFKQAIQMNSSFTASYIEAARALVLMNKRSEGLAMLDTALEHAKRMDERQRITDERTQLSELFYTNTTFQEYQNGLNFLRLERAGAAVTSFEKALTVEPDNVAILVAYAQALQLEEGLSASVRPLEQAYKINPEKKEMRLLLAEALLTSQHSRSLVLIKPLLKSKENSEQANILYARALAADGKLREGAEHLREYVDRNPGAQMGLFWVGKLYEKVPERKWIARKYLMTFLKREGPGSTLPKNIREEAESLLSRVNEDLQ